ncbi:hypothetical protein BKA70DRAFT_867405 [Coprinopsis sp. MPI-PUGE-AT-0042]|nr:hypothetical protein BKA70DRAFT_867405 [Coprinopsis sp. MPI-PUGE-AT-0042]
MSYPPRKVPHPPYLPDRDSDIGMSSDCHSLNLSIVDDTLIGQVEKRQVKTSATQIAGASQRRKEAHFPCPVPGCGSTFTRRFNLRGHLRSHTEERPYVCEWPGCKKGFARQSDCKRHQALHTAKAQTNVCLGCKKTFSRLDALNRHLRSDGGAECRPHNPKFAQMAADDERLRQAQDLAAATALSQAATHTEKVQQGQTQAHMMAPSHYPGLPPPMLPPPRPHDHPGGMPPMPGLASMDPIPVPASR